MKLVGRVLAVPDVEALSSTIMLLRSLLGLQFHRAHYSCIPLKNCFCSSKFVRSKIWCLLITAPRDSSSISSSILPYLRPTESSLERLSL